MDFLFGIAAFTFVYLILLWILKGWLLFYRKKYIERDRDDTLEMQTPRRGKDNSYMPPGQVFYNEHPYYENVNTRSGNGYGAPSPNALPPPYYNNNNNSSNVGGNYAPGAPNYR
jgi:hypothetical protein